MDFLILTYACATNLQQSLLKFFSVWEMKILGETLQDLPYAALKYEDRDIKVQGNGE